MYHHLLEAAISLCFLHSHSALSIWPFFPFQGVSSLPSPSQAGAELGGKPTQPHNREEQDFWSLTVLWVPMPSARQNLLLPPHWVFVPVFTEGETASVS